MEKLPERQEHLLGLIIREYIDTVTPISSKALELIATQGRLVLLVLVLQGGEVRQQMLTLAEPPSQDSLSEAAKQLNALCHAQDAEAVLAQSMQLPTLEQEVARLIAEMMR